MSLQYVNRLYICIHLKTVGLVLWFLSSCSDSLDDQYAVFFYIYICIKLEQALVKTENSWVEWFWPKPVTDTCMATWMMTLQFSRVFFQSHLNCLSNLLLTYTNVYVRKKTTPRSSFLIDYELSFPELLKLLSGTLRINWRVACKQTIR